MYILSPSILAADFGKLAQEIERVEKAGASYLHFDVMDGHFVPSISFGMPVLKAVRACTKMTLDVHLMIEDPDRYLEDFKACGADLITVHAEAATHLHRTIGKIHDLGLKAGVALNPATPLNVLEYVLADVDMVLLMTVNPGFGGQKFIPVSIEKIKKLKQWRDESGLTFDIEIDGGVGLGNVEETVRAGANVIVAGTAVFGGDAKKNVEEFRKIFQKIENEEF